MQGAIPGAVEDKEHPVFKLHWARFSCKDIYLFNFLLSPYIGCNLRMPFSITVCCSTTVASCALHSFQEIPHRTANQICCYL